MSNLTESPAWQALQQHFEQVKDVHMRDLFEQDSERFTKFSSKIDDILLDFSKTGLLMRRTACWSNWPKSVALRNGVKKCSMESRSIALRRDLRCILH